MKTALVFGTVATLAAVVAGIAAAAAPSQPAAPAALEILSRSVSFRSLPGNGQVPAYAEYLRDVLTGAGFAPEDIRIERVPTEAGETATLTARWRGRDARRKPMLLIGHMDVVDARREDWQRDPFVATVDGAYVYGRGVQDNKFDISMMVAALLKLRRSGWQPGRDVVLALTGDEETTAISTQRLAGQLKDAEFALNGDSGGGVLAESGDGAVVYQVQAGEKTYVDMKLTVTDAGGHSSRPTRSNAIYRLARALAKIEAYEFPLRSNELTQAYFRASAPNTSGEVGEAMRRYVADPSDAAAVAALSANPQYVGQLRTTCVATQAEAGHAPNALPQRAVANVNCRVFPGTSPASVRQTILDVAGEPGLQVEYDLRTTFESTTSPLRDDILKAVQKAVRARHADVPIVPTMSAGSTDGTHFRGVGVPTYGVSGLFMKGSDNFAHGLDERVPLAAIDGAVAHWESLVRELAR